MEHKLEIDVHAHWNNTPPVYRLFVNDEMFIERTFGWTCYQWYLKENLNCDLDTGVHTLRLENLNHESTFELDNFKVNNRVVHKNLMKSNGNKIEWKFIVDLINPNSHANHTTIKLQEVSRPTPLAPKAPAPSPPSIPLHKKYETNLALVQRLRELNNKAARK